MLYRLKNYSAQFKSSVGFKRWTNDCSWWSFLDLARVLHICNVSAYLGNETATNVAVTLRKIMGAGCVFIGVVLFSCQDSSKYTAQRLLFLLQQVFFSCLELCCTQGCLNRQASPYSCLSFSGPYHYYHFLLPPDATKSNTPTSIQV